MLLIEKIENIQLTYQICLFFCLKPLVFNADSMRKFWCSRRLRKVVLVGDQSVGKTALVMCECPGVGEDEAVHRFWKCSPLKIDMEHTHGGLEDHFHF